MHPIEEITNAFFKIGSIGLGLIASVLFLGRTFLS